MKIEIGVRCNPVDHGHSPWTYHFKADTIINIVGSYGITGSGNCQCRTIDVVIPDWVSTSEKYPPEMGIPGRNSKTGTSDMCFVVCAHPQEAESKYFGAVDQDALIDKAIAGGMLLIYPDINGDMRSIPVAICRD